ncbi:hypothetical protein GCM10025880_44870 [Methylorubrum aminovorans]|nr:hypothetical protein GCM10025880_44870 [Methylorubrum aminovorans]
MCQAHVDRIGAVLARVVADGMREGAFTVADPKSAAACLQAGVTRYCHPMLVGRQPNTIEPPLPVMIAFLLGALRAAGR